MENTMDKQLFLKDRCFPIVNHQNWVTKYKRQFWLVMCVRTERWLQQQGKLPNRAGPLEQINRFFMLPEKGNCQTWSWSFWIVYYCFFMYWSKNILTCILGVVHLPGYCCGLLLGSLLLSAGLLWSEPVEGLWCRSWVTHDEFSVNQPKQISEKREKSRRLNVG